MFSSVRCLRHHLPQAYGPALFLSVHTEAEMRKPGGTYCPEGMTKRRVFEPLLLVLAKLRLKFWPVF